MNFPEMPGWDRDGRERGRPKARCLDVVEPDHRDAVDPRSKLRFRGREAIFTLILAGLAIPAQVALQPLLVMMRHVGIGGSLFALLPP